MAFAACGAFAACKSEAARPVATTTSAAGDTRVQAAAAVDAAPPARPGAKPREGGPTQAQCEQFADHTGKFLVESMAPAGADATQLRYVQDIVKHDRPNNLRFCLEALEVPEVECVIKASDFPALAACERLRRQIPLDMLKRAEVTPEDCERFYVRYKQFMMTEGIPPAQIEGDKDQLIRTCQDKAEVGTIACFLTATTYEEARRCP